MDLLESRIIHPCQLLLLASPLDDIQYLHRAEEYKLLLISQHWFYLKQIVKYNTDLKHEASENTGVYIEHPLQVHP